MTQATSLAVQPSSRLAAVLVKAFDIGPREVGRDDFLVVLARARPAHRAPLTEPHAVPPTRPHGHDASHLAAVLGHRQAERGAPELLIGLRSQYRAHVRARDAHIPVLEGDPQLPYSSRGGGARDLDLGDALEPAALDVHHRRERSRQYSAQLRGIPFLAPAKARREIAVVMAAAGCVRHRTEVGLGPCVPECLL